MKLIDKDALVAEIKRYKHKADERLKIKNRTLLEESKDIALQNLCGNLLHYVNSLEVKEVDLDFQRFAKEMDAIFALPSSETKNTEEEPLNWEYAVAKHFFELGVNASNSLTWKDIDLILDITDQIANDDSMEEKLNNMSQEKYCTEVLKRFKAQKGE